jgi:hypothetical protein
MANICINVINFKIIQINQKIKVMAWYWIVLITLGAVILGGVIAIAWILKQIGGK